MPDRGKAILPRHGREPLQRRAGEAGQQPLAQHHRPERLVEADRRLVPVEHAPLEAPAAALDDQCREAREQRLADAAAAMRGLHEHVLEIQAGLAEEGRERGEEEREAHRAPPDLGDQRLARGTRTEERRLERRRRALGLVGELLVHGELADQAQQLGHVGARRGADQKTFFHSRSSAKTSTGPASSRPAWRRAAATTSGSAQRRKGLVASSSAMVEGSVGSPPARFDSSRALRSASAALPGSTASAKRMFAIVYSCPQYTRVAPGRRASLPSESTICAGVPSKSRPQPQANSVSPQKSSPAPASAMWPAVWPGMSSAASSMPMPGTVMRSPSASRWSRAAETSRAGPKVGHFQRAASAGSPPTWSAWW